MQSRAIVMLVIALLFGGIAVFLVNSLLTRQLEEQTKVTKLTTQKVAVAAADLDVGTRLEQSLLSVVDWPESSVPAGSFSGTRALVGEQPPIVLREIRKGEPILSYKLSPHGARGGLTIKIPADKRAITIPVNEVRGVGGFVLPGDRVDVLLTTDTGRANNDFVTRTLMEAVTVLGVDQLSSEEEDEPRVVNAVTLLVTPEEGEKLTLAQKVGNLTLLLRNEADITVGQGGVTTLSALRYTAPRKSGVKRVARGPSGPSVQVIRGLKVSRQKVRDAR